MVVICNCKLNMFAEAYSERNKTPKMNFSKKTVNDFHLCKVCT